MQFADAIKSVYTKYASVQGRASRSEYWFFHLFYFVTVETLNFAFGDYGIIIVLVCALGSTLPAIAVTCRRLQDLDRSGWWFLLFVTVVGIPLLIYWMACRGTIGANRYGPEPCAESVVTNPKLAPTFLSPDFDKLERLAKLRDSGVLTEAEFDEQKARLLGGSSV